jgi:uncharacterized protein
MNQLFLQLVQSVTGNVVTIVALEVAAAIIGFLIAWFYAKSINTPIIKGLEADIVSLNKQADKLQGDIAGLNEKADKLSDKVTSLENELTEKDKEIKDLSARHIQTGKYEIKVAKDGGLHFNLKATNGQIILTSLMYHTLEDLTKGIKSVRENCVDDNMYERKISSNNKPFFNFKAPNGEVVGTSEMYESNAGMENGIESVKRNGSTSVEVEV